MLANTISETNPIFVIHLTALGRLDEAIAESRRAQRLDPLSLVINSWMGLIFHFMRQPDRAIEQCRQTLEIDPRFFHARSRLLLAYEQKGMYEEALTEAKKGVTLSGSNPPIVALLGHAYALTGRRAEATRILDELQKLSKLRYVSPYWIALIYVGLGEKDQAFAWLEKAYEEHAFELPLLKMEPELDPLRTDSRFEDLLRRMRFPP